MWLGDLDALSQRDLQMLAAHNINSDHDIGSEFYEGQIEAIFSEISQEQRLIREQGRFAALLVKDFCGLRFLKMEKEAVDLMSNLRRPIYFTDDEFGSAMETMTKLLIERIDAVGLRADLLPHLSAEEVKATSGFRELRWLQLCASEEKTDRRTASRHVAPICSLRPSSRIQAFTSGESERGAPKQRRVSVGSAREHKPRRHLQGAHLIH